MAAQRLGQVLRGASFAPFSSSDIADGRDRALANRLVTTALRRHGHLTLVIDHLLDRGLPAKSGDFEALLRLSLAQLLYLPDMGDHSALFLAGEAAKADPKMQHLGGLMNAVLRRAQGMAAELREGPLELLLPEALREIWRRAYGDTALISFAQALLDGAPLDLTLRDDDPQLITDLGAMPLLGDTVRVAARDLPVDQLAGFAEGRFWVQDAASAIPARLLNLPEGSRVLDLCAAPGGKTAQLVKAGYSVTALDREPARIARLKTNLTRLGYSPAIVTADALAYTPAQPFDGVLLDAPCSATGTFRRHPEVLLHRDRAAIASLVAAQRKFIARAAEALKPGGTLIYCVCSLEPDEGEAQARWALDAGLGLAPLAITAAELGWPEAITAEGQVRTHPGLTFPPPGFGTLDGFFVARFRKL